MLCKLNNDKSLFDWTILIGGYLSELLNILFIIDLALEKYNNNEIIKKISLDFIFVWNNILISS